MIFSFVERPSCTPPSAHTLARSVCPIAGCSACDQQWGARLAQILDLFVEDGRLNVYAGELKVRPPVAPTTQSLWRPNLGASRRRNASVTRAARHAPDGAHCRLFYFHDADCPEWPSRDR
jgi:hypothetical protein